MRSVLVFMAAALLGVAYTSAPAFAGEACCPKKSPTTQSAEKCKDCKGDVKCDKCLKAEK